MQALRKVEATFASKLPTAMRSFYEQLNGCKVVWTTKPDAPAQASGILDIPALEEAFGGGNCLRATDWDDYVTHGDLWNDELRESEPDAFSQLHDKLTFDRHLGRNRVLMQLANDDDTSAGSRERESSCS